MMFTTLDITEIVGFYESSVSTYSKTILFNQTIYTNCLLDKGLHEKFGDFLTA